MGFKDLFFINNEEKKTEPKEDSQKSFKTKFPSSGSETSTVAPPTVTRTEPTMAITPDNPACAPHMDKIMKLYEDGFNGLNLADSIYVVGFPDETKEFATIVKHFDLKEMGLAWQEFGPKHLELVNEIDAAMMAS